MFSLVNTDYCVAWMLQKVACVIACVSKDQLEPVMQTGRYEPYEAGISRAVPGCKTIADKSMDRSKNLTESLSECLSNRDSVSTIN